MAGALGEFTEEEFFDQLQAVQTALMVAVRPTRLEVPQAYLLGGQSGAGKTTLHKVIGRALDGNAIVINGDAYRKRHPRFAELQEAYGDDAVEHTALWAGKMVEALVSTLSSLGYNLVIEGTLRTSEVPLATARLLRERGYDVSLALMAVKPEISLVSCQLRYEQMRLAGTVPRATDPAHHRKIVDQIVENLAVLEQSGAFDDIALYDRKGGQVHPVAGVARRASAALEDVLFGSWTEEERAHLEYLEGQLATLRAR